MTILVVQADPLIAGALGERYGDDVIAATTGEEALSIAREKLAELDLVLLELDLPDTGGETICRRLAALLIGVPIIACSKHDDDDTVARAFQAGAHDFVAKPFRPRELTARVRVALQLRAERRRHKLQEQRLVQWTRQLEKTKGELESVVCNDPLTGIANRRHFETVLRSEWRRAARDHGDLSLVLLDLDDFHAYNEHYGHVGGDDCLNKVTRALAHALRRASDVVARYGGEELVAILPDTDRTGARVVAERLRACVEELAIPHAASRCCSVVTVSAGVATIQPTLGLAADTLVTAADQALYRAKHAGRNRCCAADGDRDRVVVTRQPWPTCPLVILDPIFVQRVPKFLESARAEAAEAIACAHGGDLAPARRLAASLRRSLPALGLEQVATRLADADPANAIDVLEELAWRLAHIHVVYRRPVLRAV